MARFGIKLFLEGKRVATQEEVRIIFSSSIASTHWNDTQKIVFEYMSVQCTNFKTKHS